jgi:hypothetical protein
LPKNKQTVIKKHSPEQGTTDGDSLKHLHILRVIKLKSNLFICNVENIYCFYIPFSTVTLTNGVQIFKKISRIAKVHMRKHHQTVPYTDGDDFIEYYYNLQNKRIGSFLFTTACHPNEGEKI